jgi:hypothetical protein
MSGVIRHLAAITSKAVAKMAALAATALLLGLSCFNCTHTPAFDCVRAGACLLRHRRMSAELEQRAPSSIRIERLIAIVIPLSIARSKEALYVRW